MSEVSFPCRLVREVHFKPSCALYQFRIFLYDSLAAVSRIIHSFEWCFCAHLPFFLPREVSDGPAVLWSAWMSPEGWRGGQSDIWSLVEITIQLSDLLANFCFLVPSWEKGVECDLQWESDACMIACDLGFCDHNSGGLKAACVCIRNIGTKSGKRVWLLAYPALHRSRGQPQGTANQSDSTRSGTIYGSWLFSPVTRGCCLLFTQALSPITLQLNIFPRFSNQLFSQRNVCLWHVALFYHTENHLTHWVLVASDRWPAALKMADHHPHQIEGTVVQLILPPGFFLPCHNPQRFAFCTSWGRW